jgi:hypothetical protein
MNLIVVTVPPALNEALRAHSEAERQAARWEEVCARWTRICGFSVWREGHPLDREKLRQRRLWRRLARMEHANLRRALGLSP